MDWGYQARYYIIICSSVKKIPCNFEHPEVHVGRRVEGAARQQHHAMGARHRVRLPSTARDAGGDDGDHPKAYRLGGKAALTTSSPKHSLPPSSPSHVFPFVFYPCPNMGRLTPPLGFLWLYSGLEADDCQLPGASDVTTTRSAPQVTVNGGRCSGAGGTGGVGQSPRGGGG